MKFGRRGREEGRERLMLPPFLRLRNDMTERGEIVTRVRPRVSNSVPVYRCPGGAGANLRLGAASHS